jgi:uncharacterized RDD family membrane protein YckC
MAWLWFIGPLTFIGLVIVFGVWPSKEERRMHAELERWIRDVLGPLRSTLKKGATKSRKVREVPPQFGPLLEEIGGGSRVTDLVLVPKLAYVAVRAADSATASNQYTVLCKLADPAPSFVCRPVPIVDGRVQQLPSIHFKDAEFADHFVVNGDDEKAIKKWLSASVREALLDLPEVWVRTEGRSLAVTLYGSADADTLDELVAVADALYAEHGAGDEPLFGEPAEAPKRSRRAPLDRESDPADEEDDEDEVELEPAPAGTRTQAAVLDLALYAIGGLLLAAVLGAIPSFHPAVLFNSPDLVIEEPWQGGWTTKGFGAICAVLGYLLGLVALQAHLATRSGQSLGKVLFGLRTVRLDGSPVGFWRGVALRSWLFAAIPLAVAAAMARPSSARAFFAAVPTLIPAAVAGAVLVVLALTTLATKAQRGLHDLLAGTRVVRAVPFHLEPVQLGLAGLDPIVMRRLSWGAAIFIGFVVLNVFSYEYLNAWFLEVHRWRWGS